MEMHCLVAAGLLCAEICEQWGTAVTFLDVVVLSIAHMAGPIPIVTEQYA